MSFETRERERREREMERATETKGRESNKRDGMEMETRRRRREEKRMQFECRSEEETFYESTFGNKRRKVISLPLFSLFPFLFLSIDTRGERERQKD